MLKKVLYVTHNSELGGANIALLSLLKAVKSRGIIPYVALPAEGAFSKALRAEKIEFRTYRYCSGVVEKRYVDPRTLFFLRRLNNIRHQVPQVRELRRMVKEWGIDLIHCNSSYTFSGALTGFLYHIPYVWHLREDLEGQFGSRFYHSDRMMKKLFQHAEAVICVSKYVALKYNELLKKSKVKVIYDGVEVSNREYSFPYRFDEESIHIFYAGGNEPKKGKGEIGCLIKALRGIRGHHFVVWAAISDDDKSTYLREDRSEVTLNTDVELRCFKPMVKAEFDSFRRKMTFFFQPSVFEAFGLVTAEAMLLKIPVIAVTGGCNNELVEDGETGYKYSAGNIEELRTAIMRALADKDANVSICENAYRFVLECCSVESNMKGVMETYGL